MPTDKPITDQDIQALADGALSGADRELVCAAVEASSSLRGRYEELLRQKTLLQAWWTSDNKYTS